MLIKDAFSMYEEEEIIAGGLSKKTLESYVYAEKLASDYFSATSNIEDIQPIDVRSFYQHLLTWQNPIPLAVISSASDPLLGFALERRWK